MVRIYTDCLIILPGFQGCSPDKMHGHIFNVEQSAYLANTLRENLAQMTQKVTEKAQKWHRNDAKRHKNDAEMTQIWHKRHGNGTKMILR